MRIVLFAAGRVGREAAGILAAASNQPVALVVDSRADTRAVAEIVDAAAVREEAVFTTKALEKPKEIDRLRSLEPDLGILAWWPYIVCPELLAVPRIGCLNFHPSLLPHNRGKHYNFWSIVEEAPFGVSLHWASEEVDAGDIAFQRPISTTWEDTGETLYKRAQAAIVDLFRDRLDDILAGRIPRKPQQLSAGSFHRAAELEPASRIELDGRYTARQLLNLLRARTFPPHPAAWFEDGEERFEVRVSIKRVE